MNPPVELNGDAVGLGRGALHTLRKALHEDLGDQADVRLQEAGHAAGADLYPCFERWLTQQGIADAGGLDASQLGRVLSDFFAGLGWGRLHLERLGTSGLAIDAADWAEADPQANASYPSCHLSAGLLAGFMGALAQQTVSVMEVECRSCNQPRCRFVLGTPAALDAIYQAMSQGRDYHSVLD